MSRLSTDVEALAKRIADFEYEIYRRWEGCQHWTLVFLRQAHSGPGNFECARCAKKFTMIPDAPK